MTGILDTLHHKRHFDIPEESERLEEAIKQLILDGRVEEIAASRPEHPRLEEHWYRDVATGDVYRYCPPEYPARGTWERIANQGV